MQINKDHIIRARRELHKIPEIGFELPKTLAFLRAELDKLNIPYTEELGTSSIVATVGSGSKTIGIRADTDALPVQEETGLPFASTHPGMMHACGHDCHTAMLLGTAKALKEMEAELRCCVKLIFQACEEGTGGAESLCRDGLMEQVDTIVACHIMSDQPSGAILLNAGCTHASCRNFAIHLYGKSCHVARPHRGVDAIAMAARVYTDIQVMRARETDPFDPVVIGIGQIHGGSATNIVCDHVVMHGTIRAQSPEMDALVYRRILEICENTARDMGGSSKVELIGFTPCVINDGAVTQALREAAEKVVSKEQILERPRSMGSEDFSFYLQHKPGAMIYLGVAQADKPMVPLHNGKMDPDESALDLIPRVFVQFVLDQMEK